VREDLKRVLHAAGAVLGVFLLVGVGGGECDTHERLRNAEKGRVQRRWAEDLKKLRYSAHANRNEGDARDLFGMDNTARERVLFDPDLIDSDESLVYPGFRNVPFPSYHLPFDTKEEEQSVERDVSDLWLEVEKWKDEKAVIVSPCFGPPFGVHGGLKKKDLLRLRWNPDAEHVWLNDAIVNLFLDIFRVRDMKMCEAAASAGNVRKRTLFFPSFFIDYLTKQTLKRFSKDAAGNVIEGASESEFNFNAKEYKSYDFENIWKSKGFYTGQGWKDGNFFEAFEGLLVPINMNSHWTLLYVDLRRVKMSYLDSYSRQGISRGKAKGQFFMDLMQRFLGDVWLKEKGNTRCPDFSQIQPTHIPQQGDQISCGLFLLAYAETISRTGGYSFSHLTKEEEPYFQTFLGTTFRKKMILHLRSLLHNKIVLPYQDEDD